MSISDRLDEIRAHIIRAREGRHTDRYIVLDVYAPAMLAALRAVLDMHVGVADGCCDECPPIRCAVCEEWAWPCLTVRAIHDALGEGDGNA